jgi:hypothetical protein
MANREKIKIGMMELMAMSIDNITKALSSDKSDDFSQALREYAEHRNIAMNFLDKEYIEMCDINKDKLNEEYSRRHSGVML